MYLYPYKLFTISKNKRLLKIDEPQRTVGIYDVTPLSYAQALKEQTKIPDSSISILLGKVCGNTKLMVLDLDDCFTSNGLIEPQTREFLKEFKPEEYEVSTSGEGIHIYVLTNLDLETFIVKDLEGCKSFECYTNKRHIVTTNFDFENTDLKVGVHDKFILDLYKRVTDTRMNTINDLKAVFAGSEYKTEQDLNAKLYNRTPVTDMYTLRGLGLKDSGIIDVIDCNPDSVDQSAQDAKLVRKLMYYTLSFDAAWDMAMKTNYYKAKDAAHKKKFNSSVYKERTRRFIERTS